MANWKMDEAAGASVMQDSAPAGGANQGTITSVVTGVAPLVSGKAYSFDGATSYVTVPDNAALDPLAQNLSLQASIKVADGRILDDSYDIVRKGYTTTPGGDWKMELLRMGSDSNVGKLHCYFKGVVAGRLKSVEVTGDVDVVDGAKHTLRCVKTASNVSAVVDGRWVTKAGSAGSISNNQPVIIGSKVAGDDVFLGVIDQVTVTVG